MLIWDGAQIYEVNDDEAQKMIDNGDAVSVGPFDGLRVFPTKEEMKAAAKPKKQPTRRSSYTTKDITAEE